MVRSVRIIYTEGHLGIIEFLVQIIGVTDLNNSTERESFSIEKLEEYIPKGLMLKRRIRVIYVK